MQLKNRVAIITGAANGIGKGIAEKFIAEGAKVAIVDFNKEEANKAAAELSCKNGEVIAIAMDVTDENQVNEGVEKVVSTFGYVDILVSNAGFQHIDNICDLSFSNWKKILSVHLDGAFLTTRACLKSMYTSGNGGNIVYTGSVHSKIGSAGKGPYTVAKHGLIGLCKVIAKEGAPFGVRANVFCPSFVRTKPVENQMQQQMKKFQVDEEKLIKEFMLKETVDGQFSTIEEIAEVVTFLASFKGNALTGQSFMVSHGWFMQ